MTRVTGLGGVFMKCQDTEKLKEWYGRHLGLDMNEYGSMFTWRDKDNPERVGATIFGFFQPDTDYFEPSKKEHMLNFRVDDLDAVLAALRAEGVTVDDKVEDCEYGRFGWIMDPEGNRIELWEPKGEEGQK